MCIDKILCRGTTPCHRFKIPDEFADVEFEKAYLTYSQSGTIRVEKTLDDMTRNETTFEVQLSQEETLSFVGKNAPDVKIQLRLLTVDGKALASKVKKIDVDDILKDGVI